MTEQNLPRSQERSRSRGWRVALLVLAGLAIALLLGRGLTGGGETDAPQAARAPSVTVEVVTVEARRMSETVRGVGTLRASAVVEIAPEVGGRITALEFAEGATVRSGQVLVRLRDARLREQLNSREAALEAARSRALNAERMHARAEALRAERQISEGDYEQRLTEMRTTRAEVQGLEADIAALREQLAELVIRAPFTGEISEHAVDEGAFIESGRRIATLYRIDPLHMSFSIPERYAGRVSLEDQVEITVASLPRERFAAQLDFISPSIDERSRTLALRATVENTEGRLRPGSFGTARVLLSQREDLPVLPEEALVGTRDGYIVFVVEDGVARRREVVTGLRESGLVAIAEGLSPGEVVVRLGHQRVNDGSRVEITARDRATAGR